MYMKFTKMQGCGNDYIYINCFKEEIKNIKELAIKLSDRHFGIGSDGIILIKSSDKADFKMDMYNADGSQAQMCGNGIRCVAKYVYDYGLTNKTNISIETLAGIKYLDLQIENKKVKMVTVDMGSPITAPKEIPVISDKDIILEQPIKIDNKIYQMTCVSMGNPHAVIWVDDTKKIDIEKVGTLFENNELFPEKTNAEFIHVINKNTIDMRVWERGSGETLACGTGACASVVACVLSGKTDEKVTVKLLGGELLIYYDRKNNKVFMTGPAIKVFDGEINL